MKATLQAQIAPDGRETTYHYRVVASNEYGTVPGPDQTFTTLSAALIEVSVSAVAGTSATLQAQINPLGSETTAYFQYGTVSCTASPASCTDAPSPPGIGIGLEESDQPMSIHLQGLMPNTTYYYRAVAVNALGTVEGPDQTFTTQPAGGEFVLPDGRELVTPPNKHGAGLDAIGGGGGALIQAAEGGGAITYAAEAPIVAEPQGNRSFEVEQAFSRRGPGGWETQDIATPHNEASDIRIGDDAEYYFFSTDLSLGLVDPLGSTALPPLSEGSEPTPYLRNDLSGEYEPLVTTANTLPGAKYGGGERVIVVEGVDPDLGRVVLNSEVPLVAGAASDSLYEWSGEQLGLVSVLPEREGGGVVDGRLGDVNVDEAEGEGRRSLPGMRSPMTVRVSSGNTKAVGLREQVVSSCGRCRRANPGGNDRAGQWGLPGRQQ